MTVWSTQGADAWSGEGSNQCHSFQATDWTLESHFDECHLWLIVKQIFEMKVSRAYTSIGYLIILIEIHQLWAFTTLCNKCLQGETCMEHCNVTSVALLKKYNVWEAKQHQTSWKTKVTPFAQPSWCGPGYAKLKYDAGMPWPLREHHSWWELTREDYKDAGFGITQQFATKKEPFRLSLDWWQLDKQARP